MEKLIKGICASVNLKCQNLTKATSGFTNLVYFIDDKYVIKMSSNDDIKKRLDKEISIYKNIKIDCIPEFIASGEYEDYKFLIISKIKGNGLYSIWHTLSKDERYSCVNQIASILKTFNNIDYNFLSNEYKHLDWLDYIKKELLQKLKLLESRGVNCSKLNSIIENDLQKLFADSNIGLVYNDAHFDNFIYNKGKLYVIDFDRVIASAIDYEMLIFKSMCDNPSKFASEDDEDKIIGKDYDGVYEQFKGAYKELFDIPYIEERIKIYQFNYSIGHAIKCNDSNRIKELMQSLNNI